MVHFENLLDSYEGPLSCLLLVTDPRMTHPYAETSADWKKDTEWETKIRYVEKKKTVVCEMSAKCQLQLIYALVMICKNKREAKTEQSRTDDKGEAK